MVRRFRLQNAKGDLLDLMSPQHFAYDPSGLGVSLANEYHQSGTSSVFSHSELNQGELSVKLAIGLEGRPYSIFKELGTFFNALPLTLLYKVDEEHEYMRDCRLKELTKSELVAGQYLDEELKLEFTSLWYEWDDILVRNQSMPGCVGKVYGYTTREYLYTPDVQKRVKFFRLDNTSLYFGVSDHSPIEVTVQALDSAVINPSWYIEQDGQVVQSDGYRLTLKPGEQLVVSSDTNDRRAEVVAPNGVITNVYPLQDLSKTNFVTAPLGESLLACEVTEDSLFSCRLKREYVVI